MLPRAGAAQLHRLVADHLAVAAVALDHQDGAALADQLGVTVGHELSGADLFDVDRQQADAVQIVACQVRLDQMVGHQSRLTLGAAARGADRMAQRVQLVAREDRHPATREDMASGHDLRCRSPESKGPLRRSRVRTDAYLAASTRSVRDRSRGGDGDCLVLKVLSRAGARPRAIRSTSGPIRSALWRAGFAAGAPRVRIETRGTRAGPRTRAPR